MKIIERKDIDEGKWGKWCDESIDFSPFSRLEYLDAVSDRICFVINDDNTGGLALPYIQRMGVKTLYTPVFCRWIMWIGKNQPGEEELTNFVSKHLKFADVYTKNSCFIGQEKDLIYQTVTPANFVLNNQAKRKIKKAEVYNWKTNWDQNIDESVGVIRASLTNKFKTLEDTSFPNLHKLAENFQQIGKLKILSLLNSEHEMIGALLLIIEKNHCLYLKGACHEEVKNQGGMYFLMNEAIRFASEAELTFDFGGSRIPGVRKFNSSFGSTDQIYKYFRWNKGPLWFSFLRAIRRKYKDLAW